MADPIDEKLAAMNAAAAITDPYPDRPVFLQLESMACAHAIASAPGSPAGLSPGEIYAQHKDTLRREVRRQLLDLARAGDRQLAFALFRILVGPTEEARRNLIDRLYGPGYDGRYLSDEDQRRRHALALLTFDSAFQDELQLILRAARTP